MRVFWWQAGLHFEPESEQDSAALITFASCLNIVDVDQSISTGLASGGHLANQNPVVSVRMGMCKN